MPRHARYDRSESLRKALHLFWSKGYHASSLKQLEIALDMRPASIYAAFGSKDSLFAEAFTLYGEAGLAELDEHMEHDDSIIDALQGYLRHVADACCDSEAKPAKACLIVKTLLEASNTHSDLSRIAQEYLDRIEARLEEWLERAKEKGELSPNTDCGRLARLMQGQIIAIRAMAERALDAPALRDLADDMGGILDRYRT